MRILITGAAGMIGRKLVNRLVHDGQLAGRKITALRLHDIVLPEEINVPDVTVKRDASDFSAPGVVSALVKDKPDVIFHLAGVVSGLAETDPDLGYRVNVEASRALFEAVKALRYRPRIVFSSSSAVFGGPFPDVIPDTFYPAPLTSYGTQKLIVEGLLIDYTRRGDIDGIGIRLPGIHIRPGKPNTAAAGYRSGIIREPLNGIEAVLPVPRSVRSTSASPRAAVNFLIHAAGIDGDAVGPRRNLIMPGVVGTVGEQIEALRRVAGDDVVKLIREEPNDAVWQIVKTWPSEFDTSRARDLGFKAEGSFDEIINTYIEEEFGGKIPPKKTILGHAT